MLEPDYTLFRRYWYCSFAGSLWNEVWRDAIKSICKEIEKKGMCLYQQWAKKCSGRTKLLALGVPQGMIVITAAPVPEDFPDTDPQTIFIKYPSLYDPIPYIPDRVKIEVNVRSLNTPHTQKNIQSVLNEFFPQAIYGETPFPVMVVEARKTFWKKHFLCMRNIKNPIVPKSGQSGCQDIYMTWQVWPTQRLS